MKSPLKLSYFQLICLLNPAIYSAISTPISMSILISNGEFLQLSSYSLSPVSPTDSSQSNNSEPSVLVDLLTCVFAFGHSFFVIFSLNYLINGPVIISLETRQYFVLSNIFKIYTDSKAVSTLISSTSILVFFLTN